MMFLRKFCVLVFTHSSHVLQVHCSSFMVVTRGSMGIIGLHNIIGLTFVCYESQMRWLGISLEALLLNDGQPVIQVFKTRLISDVVHKHNYLQNEQHTIVIRCNDMIISNLRDNHIYSCPAFSLLVFVHQYPTPAVPHLHHLWCVLYCMYQTDFITAIYTMKVTVSKSPITLDRMYV